VIYRLKHFFTGHQWVITSSVFNRPSSFNFTPSCDNHWRAIHGYTVILRSCSCGASRNNTAIGDHSAIKAQSELDALERMVR